MNSLRAGIMSRSVPIPRVRGAVPGPDSPSEPGRGVHCVPSTVLGALRVLAHSAPPSFPHETLH